MSRSKEAENLSFPGLALDRKYKIGQVAESLGLKAYVLRFWESEFPQIAPERTEKGQRVYSENQIHLIRKIRHLLHEEGMTIEGAKKRLGEDERLNSVISKVKSELEEIRKILK